MAVLKYLDENGNWTEVGLSQQAVTPESIGALPSPSDATEGQILTYNGESWEAADAPEGGVTSVNGNTGDVNLTASDVGLGSVDNVKQYSESNPPPYPVVTVNGVSAVDQNITLTADSFDDVARISTKIDLTLSRTSWNNNNEYVIQNEAIKADSLIEALPPSTMTKEQLESFGSALIIGSAQTNGSLTLKSLGDRPTISIPITLIIRGDI